MQCNAADAELFVVGGVDGEGQVAMESTPNVEYIKVALALSSTCVTRIAAKVAYVLVSPLLVSTGC
jgi:hypothetical protein